MSKVILTPEKLRKVRERLGLTTDAFAERLGVSEDAVAFWERGDTHPEPAAVAKMKELLREGKVKPWHKRHVWLTGLLVSFILGLLLWLEFAAEGGLNGLLLIWAAVFGVCLLFVICFRIFRVDPSEFGAD